MLYIYLKKLSTCRSKTFISKWVCRDVVVFLNTPKKTLKLTDNPLN